MYQIIDLNYLTGNGQPYSGIIASVYLVPFFILGILFNGAQDDTYLLDYCVRFGVLL